MGRTLSTRFGCRHARVLVCIVFAAVTGAIWLAGPSGGSALKGNGTIRLSGPFFRAAYGYRSASPTAAREGARYRVMILFQDDARMIPRLKARNRRLKVLMYVDMMTSDPRDPSGIADWAAYADAKANHPDWFLRDSNGNPLVFKDYPTSRVMDVGNTAYQHLGAMRVSSRARAHRFDGVFLDDASASLRWVLADGSAACITYPTTAKWQAAMYSFLSNVAPQLHRAGLLVVANIGGSIITRGLWQKWNGPLDGAMEESFTDGGTGPDSSTNGRWPPKLAHALWSETNGKISLDHAVTGTREGARYALATMLLAAHGKNLFSASIGYSREVWWPEYTTANSLGEPIGAYRVLRNGVYRRDFTNGTVLVNPYARAASRVRLGGTYSGSGLHKVTGVSLAQTSGVVLAKS
jgi:Hypothetical glycosyl hydrolase family 15